MVLNGISSPLVLRGRRSCYSENTSAASLPMLGQMAEARAGEHHLDFKPIDTSEPEDALRAAETVYQFAMQQNPKELVELSQELLIYPEGEGDAVTITQKDMEGLQPMGFLSNNIVDFYIRYLERRLSPEHRKRIYFFNSFFCRKLLGDDTAATDIKQCKVDYEQVRKWTGEVNLFERDYIFIPILRSSHWSLVIICHLSSLTSSPDEKKGSPCMLHLDPIEEKHESFEGQVQSYILQAWMERFEAPSHMDQLLALCQMKYVQAKVPQQDNGHDCGLYVLHYIEAFLVESNSADLSFASSQSGRHFTSPHFAEEVSAKRMHIQDLILEFRRISEERAEKRRTIQNLTQEVRQACEKLRACLEGEGNSEVCIEDVPSIGPIMFDAQGSGSEHVVHLSAVENTMENQQQQYLTEAEAAEHQKDGESGLDDNPQDGTEVAHAEYQTTAEFLLDRHHESEKVPCIVLAGPSMGNSKKRRNWTEEETSTLLSCKVKGGRFLKRNKAATCWSTISLEIKEKLGIMPSEDQCRLRYDTLMKAYKSCNDYCTKNDKTFSEITAEERLELKLATNLSKESYTKIDEICKAKSQKRAKLSPGFGNDPLPLNPPRSPPPLIPNRSFDPKSSFQEVAISESVCRTGEVGLCNDILPMWFSTLNEELKSPLLNLVQECAMEDRQLMLSFREVATEKVFDLEVVSRRLAIVQDHEVGQICNYVLMLRELKLVNMVPKEGEDLQKSQRWFLDLEVYEKVSKEVLCRNPCFKTYHDKFPIDQSSLQHIRVLSLCRCAELVDLNLKNFPELRILDIKSCGKLNLVTGWECARNLGWLEIRDCPCYADFPNLQCLPRLREFCIDDYRVVRFGARGLPDFSQFTQLCRLEILGRWGKWLSESVDLGALVCLEVLSLEGHSALSTIQGLSKLHALTKLKLVNCKRLSTIEGLSGLQALTELILAGCEGLRRVLQLGCLKALTYLDLSCSGVEEISGVEELHLLTSLQLGGCYSLKRLPILGHLKALAYLNLAYSGVEVISGIEDLVNLKTLDCTGSKLKRLPDLHHGYIC